MVNIKDIYKQYLRDIIDYGEEVTKDNNHHLKERLGNYYRIEDPLDLKYTVKYKDYTHTQLLTDIKSGVYNLEGSPIKSDSLLEYVKSFENSDDQGFVYTYPNRILAHFNINQFNVMKNRLLNHPGSNRAVSITLDPELDSMRDDIPCLQLLQAIIRDNSLSMHCYFRSNDIYGAFYSNMFFITYIGLKLKDELNLELHGNKLGFDGIYYYCSSGHIYRNDYHSAKKLINQGRVKKSIGMSMFNNLRHW